MILVNLHDFFEDRTDQPGRDAERGLVEHEEFRVAHQRAADGEHLLFAAGERAGGLLQALLHARKNAEDVVAILGDEGLVREQVGAHRKVFVDGEIGKHHAALGHMAKAAGDDLVGREGRNIRPEKVHGAGFRAEEAGDGAQRGGFAGAVAADQRDDRTLGNGE